MFDALLEDLTEKVGELKIKLSPDEFSDLINYCLPVLSIELEPIVGASRAVFGNNIFKNSEIGMTYHNIKPDSDGLVSVPIDVGQHHIKMDRNPEKDSTISINSYLYRCNLDRQRRVSSASIVLELDICGFDERVAFEELYKNYRRPILKLLESNKIEFWAGYCSDIVGNYKGNKISKKIDEYFSDPDIDNLFTLTKNFKMPIDAGEIIKTFLIFTALYDSCNGYIEKRKNPDRFAKHMVKLL